jgi:hypothetical protein
MKNIKNLIMISMMLFSSLTFPYVDPFAQAKFNEQQKRWQAIEEKSRQDRLNRPPMGKEEWKFLLTVVAASVDSVSVVINLCLGDKKIGYLTDYFELNPFKDFTNGNKNDGNKNETTGSPEKDGKQN